VFGCIFFLKKEAEEEEEEERNKPKLQGNLMQF
jgi:hypothetical protein